MSESNAHLLERTASEIVHLAEAENTLFVFFYTPLCGTCKVAQRMLVVAEAAEPEIKVYRCNLNVAPELARRWRISSVPCLARARDGQVEELLYRMVSAQDILLWLRQKV